MRTSGASTSAALPAAPDVVRILVMSQHEAVRRQLVAYLGRAASMAVSGDSFSPDAIVRARPDVLVLDLSQIGADGLHRAIVAAERVGARLIALASIREPTDECAVLATGGRYCLKSAGPGDLAAIVQDLAVRPA